MATFYVMPPRAQLARQFAEYLNTVFPGLQWEQEADLAETLEDLAETRLDVFVVYRDEIPVGLTVKDALRDCFGAEDADMVIEMADNREDPGEHTKLWRISA